MSSNLTWINQSQENELPSRGKILCEHRAIITRLNPDPSIIHISQNYFLVIVMFEYFLGAPIYHSTDIVSRKLTGHALP